jgi:enamine deaminase RidA (YjgF/YER057c/UK114 family)/peptidyl-tRNA hydrolase
VNTRASPLALQIAVRIEKQHPPDVASICQAAALATVALLDHAESRPGGAWHDAVTAWNGQRIRKLVRRGRGAAWQRAHLAAGVTVSVNGVEARAFVPGPMDEVPDVVAKLQIQSSELPPAEPTDDFDTAAGLVVAVTPDVAMSWGKQAAQCAHAVQRAWMTVDPDVRDDWTRAGRPVTIVHPRKVPWEHVRGLAEIHIHDGGYTEIPAGTLTTVAWWRLPFRRSAHHGATHAKDPPMTRQEVRLGGPNEARLGLSRAVRVGDHVSVGGTAAIGEDGSNVAADDVVAQAARIWEIIEAALTAAGARLDDIVRTRTLLVDRADFEAVTAVRRQVLGTTMPVDTIVEISGFVDPAWKVEIEVDAIVTPS